MHDFRAKAGALEETIAAGSVASKAIRELRPVVRRQPRHQLETLAALWLRSIDRAAAFAGVSPGRRPHQFAVADDDDVRGNRWRLGQDPLSLTDHRLTAADVFDGGARMFMMSRVLSTGPRSSKRAIS